MTLFLSLTFRQLIQALFWWFILEAYNKNAAWNHAAGYDSFFLHGQFQNLKNCSRHVKTFPSQEMHAQPWQRALLGFFCFMESLVMLCGSLDWFYEYEKRVSRKILCYFYEVTKNKTPFSFWIRTNWEINIEVRDECIYFVTNTGLIEKCNLIYSQITSGTFCSSWTGSPKL